MANCSSGWSRPPCTHAASHGGVQMKNSHLLLRDGTPQCLRCLRCKTVDNTPNCCPYLKRPIPHMKAGPKAIRQRLSNKSIFTALPLLWVTHENKGFKRETSLCEQGRGSIYKTFVIFLFTIPKESNETLTATAFMLKRTGPKHA